MEVLRDKIQDNKVILLRDLDLRKEMLTYMSRSGLLEMQDCVQLQQLEDRNDRNSAFLELIMKSSDDTIYGRIIECLHSFGQGKLANKLVDINEELLLLKGMQEQLEDDMRQMNEFLAMEERRSGIYLTEPPPDDDGNPALTEKEVWTKVQESIKKSQAQLKRCQNIIQKLHSDCNSVAKQNAEIIEHTKECDAKIREVLSTGRRSAKQTTIPKRTQDLFSNLMDDIEKLVKTRRKVITMETEGRRHSTRIIRQCRDWLEDRSLMLQKLHASPGPGAFRSTETLVDSNLPNNIRRAAPPTNDNAIMSILDSLQLLERELQEYMHLEIMMTDKYRSELRRKQLTKKVHGFSSQGMSEAMGLLNKLEKDPAAIKQSIEILQSVIKETDREYGECVFFLNKVEPRHASPDSQNTNSVASGNSSPHTVKKTHRQTRDWPKNFNTRSQLGGKKARSIENNIDSIGMSEKTEPNQLLSKLKTFIATYEELKSEDQSLGHKYRAEMSRKKRDADVALQKRDDQILKLQTQLKEAEAEKEKYKKLYNDTKIGHQKNTEQKS